MRADQQMLYVLIPLENHLNNLFNFWLGKGGIIEIQRHKWKHLGPTTRIFLVSHLKNDVLNCFTEENQIKVKILLFKLCNYFSDSYLKCIKVLPLKCIWLFPSFFWICFDFAGLPSIALFDGTAWKESPQTSPSLAWYRHTKPVGHGAKSWALQGFKHSIWYILQLKNRQLGEVSFPCLFRILSQPFTYGSFSHPLFLSLSPSRWCTASQGALNHR